MCKLNVLCTKIDGECSCQNSNGFTVQGSKPINSLLSSILTHIQNQPEIWRSLQTDSNLPEPELLDNSTQFSSSSSVRSEIFPEESEELFISLVSNLGKTVVAGKPFSLMLSLSNQKKLSAKLDESANFSAFIESRKNKDIRICLGSMKSSEVVFFKNLVVAEVIPNAQIVIKADKDNVKSFIQNIKIKEKKSKPCEKKVKLSDQ